MVEPTLPPTPSGPGPASGALPEDTGLVGLVRGMLKELGEQRQEMKRERQAVERERRASVFWKRIFLALTLALPLVLALGYFILFLGAFGPHIGPLHDVVGVVRIQGEIGPNKQASADKVIAALEEAFSSGNVKAVVLSIDSPGGAPSEAERIYHAIDSLKKKHQKPVVAVIDNLGASAAYLIAIHADRIVAGKYSLVGSIGALMETWQLDRALAKVDVSQRVYTSGKLKSFLNPFTPPTPEADAKAKLVVTQVAGAFLGEVKALRGAALQKGVDYATGEVWVGEEAKQLGLVDDIGTIDEVVESTWGLKSYRFGPAESGLGILSRAMAGAVEGVLERMVTAGYGRLR